MKARDWEMLRQMRAGFLTAREGLADYWSSAVELEMYDRFFAARIGWKWDAVLSDFTRLGWTPPELPVVDWGCGTGMAVRSFLTVYPGTASVEVWDRSEKARQFALQKIRAQHPGLITGVHRTNQSGQAVYLLSHILNELGSTDLAALLETLRRNAAAIIWVEPGTHEISRRLISVRETLREEFQVVAPCPHQGACGLLQPENGHHWCHQFAATPGWVFQDPEWSAFARELEIDLGTVPYSYLVLDRRPVAQRHAEYRIGRPRFYKGYARLLTCKPEAVAEQTIQKRDDPALFRQLKKR